MKNYREIGPEGLERNIGLRASIRRGSGPWYRQPVGEIDFNSEGELCLIFPGTQRKEVTVQHGDQIRVGHPTYFVGVQYTFVDN